MAGNIFTVFTSGSVIALILQAVPTGVVGDIAKLGLDGLLILAVITLWRKLEDKDKSNGKIQAATVEALTLSSEVSRELKQTVSELKEAVDKLCTVREVMSDNKKGRL
jgi:hypothetical protein